MDLLRLDRPRAFELAAGWLSAPENRRWLDFGAGVCDLDAATLEAMNRRPLHLLRLYTDDRGEPIGLAGLSGVDRIARTATPWFVLGDKRQARRGHTTRAVSRLLGIGFDELGLGAMSAWAVESNRPSIQVLRRLNFRFVGRVRRCHVLDGAVVDRLWFDLLAEEHQELAA
jgi:RimJ/RimL family protein N-acetyltransferase